MLKKITTKTRVIICSILAVFALLSAFLFTQLYPYQLGDQISYLGKEQRGLWVFPFSDSPRYDIYYYGTDLSPENLAKYFHASLSQPTSDPSSYDLSFSSGKDITIIFYQDKYDPNEDIPGWNKNTVKKNIFSILDQDFDTLKSSVSG